MLIIILYGWCNGNFSKMSLSGVQILVVCVHALLMPFGEGREVRFINYGQIEWQTESFSLVKISSLGERQL